ncbi:VOC family protein [Paludisphaera rhizosphaerae]|uniref:VOC family protein n=1 Tax=Paludisphaera rhizosphaerae TaxID=2711216 RepID=UPI0013EBE62F|nr:VOC family protein [Paludisphaera rhizosphaerae]
MASEPRKPGEFCWINILSPQPEAAKAFFSSLLGWEYGDIPGMGWFIQAGGSPVGGLFDLEGPNTPPGTPAGIGVMVLVEDADAIAQRAKDLGGDSRPAFDVGPQGRMAEIIAPDGAKIDVWQAKGMASTSADRALPGVPNWIETMTPDAERAARFYTDLFGWTVEKVPNSAVDYSIFKLDGVPAAGLMPRPADLEKVPPHWAVYMTVADADATVKKALELGGTVFVQPRDIPNYGRFAGVMSPQGVHFYIIKHAM